MLKNTEKTIHTIVARCVKLESSAQRALYDILFDNVVYASGMFKFSKVEQEDLIQESFIKIFCNIGSFDKNLSNLNTWSSTITKRVCLSYIRKKKIQLTHIDNISMDIGIEDIHSDFLELDIIYGLIEGLPLMCKEVFNLFVVQGMDHTDIAYLLDITKSTSRAYLSRAKSILRFEISNQNAITTEHLNLKIGKNV